jgi:hypothetical protein
MVPVSAVLILRIFLSMPESHQCASIKHWTAQASKATLNSEAWEKTRGPEDWSAFGIRRFLLKKTRIEEGISLALFTHSKFSGHSQERIAMEPQGGKAWLAQKQHALMEWILRASLPRKE